MPLPWRVSATSLVPAHCNQWDGPAGPRERHGLSRTMTINRVFVIPMTPAILSQKCNLASLLSVCHKAYNGLVDTVVHVVLAREIRMALASATEREVVLHDNLLDESSNMDRDIVDPWSNDDEDRVIVDPTRPAIRSYKRSSSTAGNKITDFPTEWTLDQR